MQYVKQVDTDSDATFSFGPIPPGWRMSRLAFCLKYPATNTGDDAGVRGLFLDRPLLSGEVGIQTLFPELAFSLLLPLSTSPVVLPVPLYYYRSQPYLHLEFFFGGDQGIRGFVGLELEKIGSPQRHSSLGGGPSLPVDNNI